MEATVSEELNMHIIDKINHHNKLLANSLDSEEYLACAYHRDEITRLKAMLD